MAFALPLSAFFAGFFGSLHCLGMCGGVSASIAVAARASAPSRSCEDKDNRPGTTRVIPIASAATLQSGVCTSRTATGVNLAAFNLGRIASYALAGGMAGALGGFATQAWFFGGSTSARGTLFLFANLMIVLTGLSIIGLPQVLAPLERAGGRLWRHLAPQARKFIGMSTPTDAALFGMIWGWIPCGMVYAMLLAAVGAGGAGAGALAMFAFGIGTLPAMFAAGVFADALTRTSHVRRVRAAAGLAVIAVGLFGVLRADTLEPLRAFGAFCVVAAVQ